MSYVCIIHVNGYGCNIHLTGIPERQTGENGKEATLECVIGLEFSKLQERSKLFDIGTTIHPK